MLWKWYTNRFYWTIMLNGYFLKIHFIPRDCFWQSFGPIMASSRAVIVSSNRSPFSSHSQTTITFQPRAWSSCCWRKSRSTLPFIFFSQNSALFFGQTKYLQPSCLCQKHPLIKMHVLYLGRMMSGLPGRSLTFFRYRNPRENRYFLLYQEDTASDEMKALKHEVEEKQAVLQKRRDLLPKL